jgi:L-ascorbate metabolism protein UlaG (beta-lactamase superfamily)
MFPEQTAQAGLDVGTKQIMPIHWGAFKLAMHPWTEPVERVSHKAKELNVGVLTPRIGEPINLNKLEVTTSQWWK